MTKIPILILLTGLFTAASLQAVEPKEALARFREVCKKGDLEAVRKSTVVPPGLPPQAVPEVEEKMQQKIDYFREENDFVAIDQKQDGDCAVILINENVKKGKPGRDFDPVYLLKRDGEWKFFIGFTRWKEAQQIAPETVEAFKRLEAWYNKREQEVKDATDKE